MNASCKLLIVSIISLLASSSQAEPDTHYQDFVLGERAAGMGGAFTALASEAFGAYYNPAGIAAETSTIIQLSMSAYQLRIKDVELADLCGTQLSEDEGSFFGFPASFGFVKRFHTGEIDHGVGLTVAIPFSSKSSHSYKELAKKCGQMSFDVGGSSLAVDRVFWGGLTYAIKPLRWLQIGLTAGVSLRSATQTRLAVFLWESPGLIPSPSVVFSNANVSVWSMFLQLGLIVEPIEGLRLGLAFTTPYFRLAGVGRLDILESSWDPTDLQNTETHTLDDAEYYWKVPFKLAVGAAYTFNHWLTFALDVKIHGPVSAYAMYEHPKLQEDSLEMNPRELVANINLGVEARLGTRIVGRLGAFTNFSSVSSDSLDIGDEKIHMFGFTTGWAYISSDDSSLGFTVQAMVGEGEVGGFRLSITGNQPQVETLRFKARDLRLVFMLGGSFDLS